MSTSVSSTSCASSQATMKAIETGTQNANAEHVSGSQAMRATRHGFLMTNPIFCGSQETLVVVNLLLPHFLLTTSEIRRSMSRHISSSRTTPNGNQATQWFSMRCSTRFSELTRTSLSWTMQCPFTLLAETNYSSDLTIYGAYFRRLSRIRFVGTWQSSLTPLMSAQNSLVIG